MAGGFDQLGFQAQRLDLGEHPLGGATDVGFVFGISTDAGNAQEVAELVFKALCVLGQIVVKRRHVASVVTLTFNGRCPSCIVAAIIPGGRQERLSWRTHCRKTSWYQNRRLPQWRMN